MSNIETSDDNAAQETKPEPEVKKRNRHRKSLLYDKIRKQMEFYFSDANISKDRFLGSLLQEDPLVPLSTFLKFNKIRALTEEVIDIVKSLKRSAVLDLSEDKTKVQRKTPFEPYDVDARTVYVESVPVTASLEWLQRVFSDYGHVAYISLPKFKQTSRIKGYAFVEFNTAEEAQECLNAFTKMGCKLPTDMTPDELLTIKTHAADDALDEKIETKKIEREDSCEPPKKKTKKSKEKKKIDTPVEDENKSILTTTEDEKTDLESKEELTSQDESSKPANNQKKKSCKKTVKERNRLNGKKGAPNDAVFGLQVLSKTEFKSLRNKYLNLQRKNMKELKRNWRLNKNYYNPVSDSAMEIETGYPKKNDKKKELKTPLEKIPGLFVRTELPEPCKDIRATKRQIRTNIHVVYVDVKEGGTEVFIRFDSPEAASQYCSGVDGAGQVLRGAAEQAQWALAEGAARRQRGRSRLPRPALAAAPPAAPPAAPQPSATHVRFDE